MKQIKRWIFSSAPALLAAVLIGAAAVAEDGVMRRNVVSRSGDTMTGTLTIDTASGNALTLSDPTVSTSTASFSTYTATVALGNVVFTGPDSNTIGVNTGGYSGWVFNNGLTVAASSRVAVTNTSGNDIFVALVDGTRWRLGTHADAHISCAGAVCTFASTWNVSGDLNLAGNDLTGTGTGQTFNIVSAANDTTVSTTVAALTLSSNVNVTDGDLVLNVENSAGDNLLTISEQGALTALTSVNATTTMTVVTNPAIATTTGNSGTQVMSISDSTRRYMPHYGSFKRFSHIAPADTAATTFTGVGIANPTIAGTGSITAAAAPNANYSYIQYTTNNVTPASGDYVSISSGNDTYNLSRTSHDLRFTTVVSLASVANIRIWAGIVAANLNGVDTNAGMKAAFRFSTNASDTQWTACTSDGTTQTCTATSTTVVADTDYVLTIDCFRTNSTCFFYVNNVLQSTCAASGSDCISKTTNIPYDGLTNVGYLISGTTLTAATKTFRVAKVAWESN